MSQCAAARVRVIVANHAVKMLSDFYRQDAYRDCAGPARAWYALATVAQWARPADVVAEVPKVSILKDGRTVFNLGGNKYRLVVWINYDYATIYSRRGADGRVAVVRTAAGSRAGPVGCLSTRLHV